MGKTRDLFKKIRDTKGTFPESRPNGVNGNGVEQPRFRHPDQPGVQIKAGLGGAVSWGTPTSYSNTAHGPLPQPECMHRTARVDLGTSGSQRLGEG